jgi:2-oxoglutarate dehydrogenase E2 component (dihydrolipoamide succinyltransferase)
VAEATLMQWRKQPGDAVKRGDTLIDIETDKVTLEVAAPNDGVLVEILKGDGSNVTSAEVIARIDTGATAVKAAPAAAAAPPPAPAPAANPAPAPAPAPASAPAMAAAHPPAAAPAPQAPAEAKLSPSVRALLDQHGLDPAGIPATGPGGRLTRDDVIRHVAAATAKAKAKPPAAEAPKPAAAPAPAAPRPAPATTAAPAPAAETVAPARAASETAAKPAPSLSTSGGRPEQRVPMTRLRRRAAERLLAAQHENAILTTFNEVNMEPVMALRNRYKEEFERSHGVKLGFMSFFTRAAVDALKKFPLLNASVSGEDIVYHGYFDIGIAVSSPRGLVVPIIRDADMLSLAGIESKIRDFGERSKDGKLTIEELTGGTFTITNGGVFGSLLSTPIINPPQSAILGMHKIQERPVAESGQIVIRPMMYLALSYDHRIIDGREAVQFLVTIKEQIEDPARLLLQV